MKGILLVNLGSPKSPSESDVRVYLREFLMDGKVMDMPWLLRKMVVEFGILPQRPKQSAHAYQSIWQEEGSPLVVISQHLTKKISDKITSFPTELAMRYQEPSIKNGLQNLADKNIDEVLVIPLYPQYAMSTTETVTEKCKKVQKRYFRSMKLEFLPPFYNDEKYLEVLSAHIKKQLPQDFDLLLFSYHGVPERHIHKTDPFKKCRIDDVCCFEADHPSHEYCYRHQCYFVTEQVRKRLGLDKSKIMQTFQSRLGKDPWLQPYTDRTLEKLPSQGVKKIAAVAPAFISDCLETLEELAITDKKLFMENGGEEFHYIDCLNEDNLWADWLVEKIHQFTGKP
jgi:ferrochelatase